MSKSSISKDQERGVSIFHLTIPLSMSRESFPRALFYPRSYLSLERGRDSWEDSRDIETGIVRWNIDTPRSWSLEKPDLYVAENPEQYDGRRWT